MLINEKGKMKNEKKMKKMNLYLFFNGKFFKNKIKRVNIEVFIWNICLFFMYLQKCRCHFVCQANFQDIETIDTNCKTK